MIINSRYYILDYLDHRFSERGTYTLGSQLLLNDPESSKFFKESREIIKKMIKTLVFTYNIGTASVILRKYSEYFVLHVQFFVLPSWTG